ncbi:MAG: MFS transporter [Cyclobacteriaceae bacterium]
MFVRIIKLYKNAYGGLSEAAWILALVMFINRSGSMVLPFLGVYLTSGLHFDNKQAGLVMSMFGLGSMAGAFTGGWLTDTIGQFKVQVGSLILGSLMFFLLSGVTTYYLLVPGIFLLSLISESLRPANASSVSFYAKPENITRAFSLNRMAVNLGFSIGPALGGVVAAISFSWLFVADGITCMAAGLLFFFYFKNKPANPTRNKKINDDKTATLPLKTIPAYKDKQFLLFIVMSILFATCFFQIFTTLPLYFRQVYQLSEYTIGALLASNGLVVFLVEMVLVYTIGNRISVWKLIATGTVILGLAFIAFNFTGNLALFFVIIAAISLAEILAMPYMVTVTTKRAPVGQQGAYMGWYTFSFSSAFVLAPLLGTRIIDAYGFDTLWYAVGILAVLTAIGFYFAIRWMGVDTRELTAKTAQQQT